MIHGVDVVHPALVDDSEKNHPFHFAEGFFAEFFHLFGVSFLGFFLHKALDFVGTCRFVAVHKVFVEIEGGAAEAVNAFVVDVFFMFVVDLDIKVHGIVD